MGLFASLNLHGTVFVGKLIMYQPNSGEMSPSQFLNDDIFLVELFPEEDGVIAFRTVIGVVLALGLTLVLIIVFFVHNSISNWLWILL